MSAIENFLGRVKSANRTRTSDVRIPTSEAVELCAELAQVLNDHRRTKEELAKLQQSQRWAGTVDGGKL